jgi:uncharacterized membrane protein (DUF4010 family)
VAGMSKASPWVAGEGWRLIVVAALANLVFKALVVGVLGNRRLLREIAVLFAFPLAGGLALILLWPPGLWGP